MTKNSVVLKPTKDRAIRNHHHWIFSGAIAHSPEFENGDILPVESSFGDFLGYAYFNKKTSISGRMISFNATSAENAIKENIDKSVACRQKFFTGDNTNAYRIINSEGDSIPGLVVDKYNDVLVLQIATLGIDKLKPIIIEHFKKTLKPRSIYEKSNLPSRREEGMQEFEGLLSGEDTDEVTILENNLKFNVSVKSGQKTGFFLDQREMRALVCELSRGKKVLNCFGYTGGFSLYALYGGAKHVDTVDISESAIEMCAKNIALNNLSEQNHRGITSDVFKFLREESIPYDLVILDPPAFAKKKSDIVQACRGYKDINRLALQKMPAKSLLLTSSCSYHVDEKLFQQVIFQAANEAKRSVRIIGRHHLAKDHPINIYHPEGEYLKSLLLYVE